MKRQIGQLVYLLLAVMFLATTVLGLPGPASAQTTVALSTLTAGNTVQFAGYTWIVLDPSTGYLLMQSFYNNSYNFDSYSQDFQGSSIEALLDGSPGGSGGFYGSLPSADRALIQDHTWSLTNESGNTSFSPSTVQDYIGLLSYSDWETYSTYYTASTGFLANPSYQFWTLTPCSGDPLSVWFVAPGGLGGGVVDDAFAVRPALYLNPGILVSGGNGGTVIPVYPGQSTVSASPSGVPADGSTSSTVTVTLNDINGNPVSDVAVQLAPSSGSNTVITPAGGSAGSPGASASGTTGSNGQVAFTVTDTTPETVTYTATDTTDSVTVGATTTPVSFLNTADAITAFSLAGASGTIGSGTVSVTVPYGTDVSNLAATFTLSPEATAKMNGVTQENRTTANNFTNAVTYAVYAQDGVHEQDWTVTCTVQQPGSPNLASISPDSGPVGSTVTLTGSNFGSVAGSVYFNQGGNQYVSGCSDWTDESAQATVPSSLSPGSVSVAVYTYTTGLTSNSLTFTVTSSSSSNTGGGGGAHYYTPVVQTEAASSITAGSAVLNGDITSDNGYDVTDYGFLWGTSASSLTNKLDVGTSNISGGFTDTLDNLTAGTTYYFEAYATNSQGTADGAVMSFATTGTTTPTTPATPTFSDVPSTYWAYAAISSLCSQGIVSGYPDGTFKPENPITRAEFATMLVKALGLNTAGTNGTFTDITPDDWCYNSVNAAAAASLVSGIGDNLFAPNALVTREEMAVMIAKALGSKAPAVNGTELDAFSDSSTVSSWAVNGMEEAVKAGVVSGMTPTTLAPLDNATRAQAAVMIYKLLNILGK